LAHCRTRETVCPPREQKELEHRRIAEEGPRKGRSRTVTEGLSIAPGSQLDLPVGRRELKVFQRGHPSRILLYFRRVVNTHKQRAAGPCGLAGSLSGMVHLSPGIDGCEPTDELADAREVEYRMILEWRQRDTNNRSAVPEQHSESSELKSPDLETAWRVSHHHQKEKLESALAPGAPAPRKISDNRTEPGAAAAPVLPKTAFLTRYAQRHSEIDGR